MRLRFFLACLCLIVIACGSQQQQQTKAPEPEKKPSQNSEPVDLGDKIAPVEVRALKGAKEVRKRIEDQRKEDRSIVEEANH